MKVSIDPEVFKWKDPRVGQLSSGAISAEHFILLLSEQDPVVLIGSTLYMMTEAEFYALKTRISNPVLSEKAFQYMIKQQDRTMMHPADAAYLEGISRQAPRCTVCQYKRYREDVANLIRKYELKLPMQLEQSVRRFYKYPPITQPIALKVTRLLPDVFKVGKRDRKSCLDCVEKHISQAYILGNESMMGYPEHLVFVLGHLSEAIEEAPSDALELKDSLLFCLAYTKMQDKAFVPIWPLLAHVELQRGRSMHGLDETPEQEDAAKVERTLQLDFTDMMKKELSELDVNMLGKLRQYLNIALGAVTSANKDNTEKMSVLWQGSLASAADLVAPAGAIDLANMLRGRRLLYVANPALAAGVHDMQDVITHMNGIKQ